MRPAYNNLLLLAALIALASLVLIGCGNDQTVGTRSSAAETGHEGHNHAPGEHGKAATAPAGFVAVADWCAEHRVPESECTLCNPALIDKFKAKNDWCAPHELPESHCRLCNPGISFPQEAVLKVRTTELAADDISVSLFFRPNAAVCATNDALIQFASAQTAERTGLSVQRTRTAMREGAVEAPAEVKFDETKASVVSSTVPALVSRWLVSPGESVTEGDILAIAQSPEIAELEARLLSAHAAYDVQEREIARVKSLKDRKLISDAEFERQNALAEQTRAEYISLRGLLKSAGLNEADLDDIIEHRKVTNQFGLRAPASGLLVERIAQVGELLDAGRAFAMLADPSAMWIEAQLTEQQLRQVKIGQTLTFASDGRGLDRVGGTVIWVSRVLDSHTRTGTVRARVADPAHHLQAGEFGRVHIMSTDERAIVLVPRDAVQWEGCCNVVFVREALDRYRPRKVDLVDGDGGYYQVTGGLHAGEEVVVNGAFLLKTELKKTSIGAGCCGIEPAG